ncbi:unnamed protein product [Clonostachys solani]|uniref:Autophagy-related protein 29 n=1 Tax=Clonostachys solani TaxID=160281 RepID=A0A9N9W3J3_9HYPO|nr:unnamed protein product [Clonostachys solani]
MADPTYTIWVRVPIPRGDFVDPPQVHLTVMVHLHVSWDSGKDEALWKILSGAAQTEIDSETFDVPVDFLLRQVAYITERHASQVRAQVRKATAAAKVGSSAPSPVPGSESAGFRSLRRNSLTARAGGSGAGTPLNASIRPVISRNPSTSTAVLRDAGGSLSPRPGKPNLSARPAEQSGRRRLSSLPITSTPDPDPESPPSPGPAESDSTLTSEDESSPAQSRIIRRPPRFQQQDNSTDYADDEEEESEPAFQPWPSSNKNQTSAQDMTSTLRGDNREKFKRTSKSLGKKPVHHSPSQTSDSDAGSAATGGGMDKSLEQGKPGPLSPRRTAELAGRSPGSKGYSRDGSDGTPSMGSSFSDLDDASVTQSALEEALASHMNRGAGSRFSISQAFRSRNHLVARNKKAIIMFRRLPSGLPKDADFPADLEKLGYYVNDGDEIRSIEDPDYYFKFFLSKNERVNQRQRFSFNQALETIVHQRLTEKGLEKIRLPLGTPPSKPHVPIFVDADLKSKKRVIVMFGEMSQDLGVLAGRIANGARGINTGSMVSVVDAARAETSPGEAAPGLVLANMGQLRWWPEGQRAVTSTGWLGTPLPSLVHAGRRHVPEVNDIPGNETGQDHVRCVFDEVLAQMVDKDAVIDIITIDAMTSEEVEKFLDKNWGVWGHRLSSMAILETLYSAYQLTSQPFKDFLAKRCRSYIVSEKPFDTPIAPPEGIEHHGIEPYGVPVYSSSEPNHVECILITALKPIMSFLRRYAMDPDAENERVVIEGEIEVERASLEEIEESWAAAEDDAKPMVAILNQDYLKTEVEKANAWRRFQETGEASIFDVENKGVGMVESIGTC